MTIKQCNSCKYHTYELRHKHPHDGCFHPFRYSMFMKSKNCDGYKQGKLNQGKKEFYKKLGEIPPYKFLGE